MATADSSARVIAAAVVVALAAAPAHAQPTASAVAATAQFDNGRALMKDKKYAEACAAFAHSQQLDPQSGTLYNLAICWSLSGKLASAWAAFRELAQRDANLVRRKDAGKRAAALDKRLPRLVLQAPDAPAGLAITLDGVDVTGMIGADNPVDLGDHKIHAAAPGRRDLDTITTVRDEGKAITVAIELPVAPVQSADVPVRAAPAPVVAPVVPVAPDEAPRSHRRTYGVVVAAAGGALIATGLVFGKLANDRWTKAKALCGDDLMCDSDPMLDAGNKLVSEARSRATLSTAFVIGGGVALATGVVLFVTAPRGETRPATAWRITPSAGPRAVSLSLDGRF